MHERSLLVDIREAGRMLSISPWTVRLYIRQRKLRPVRLGSRVLLEPAELSRFIAECRKPENPQR